LGKDRQFPEVKQLLTAVDGTVVKTLSRIVQAAYTKSSGDGRSLSAWRLHTQFDIERGLPARIDVTGAGNHGANDERVVLRKTLQADRCYVMDRTRIALFNAIVGQQQLCAGCVTTASTRSWNNARSLPTPSQPT
jgi:hypothetical protein